MSERHFPPGYVRYTAKDCPAAQWGVKTDARGAVVIAYGGRRTRPDFHYRYPDIDAAARKVLDWLEAERYRAKPKSRKLARHGLEVGAILYTSWGYDQTNVEYFEVTRRTDKCVDLVRIASRQVNGSTVAPCPGEIVTGASAESYQNKRVGKYGVRISKSRVAHPWDGTPNYETPFGLGH